MLLVELRVFEAQLSYRNRLVVKEIAVDADSGPPRQSEGGILINLNLTFFKYYLVMS